MRTADFLGGGPRAAGPRGPGRASAPIYTGIVIIEGETKKRSRSRAAPSAAPAAQPDIDALAKAIAQAADKTS